MNDLTSRIKIIFISSFFAAGCIAQIHDCGVGILNDDVIHETSARHQANLEFESKYQAFVKSGDTLDIDNDMFTDLPIVFHIVHLGDSLGSMSNPRNQEIFDLIEKTNNYFRQQNDEANVFENPFFGADTKISFCLANRDENGNLVTGINRYVSSDISTTFLLNLVWDRNKYINVFYLNEFAPNICGSYSSGTDIVRVANRCLTKSILAHELGHYLNLKHTFLIEEDCSNEDCTMQGDLVCDTPPKFVSATAALEGFENEPCQFPANTCDSDEDDTSINNPYRSLKLGGMGDQADPNSNIMGNTNPCKNNFTQGQAIRMQMNLLEKRQELWMQETQCESNFMLDNDAIIDRITVTSLNECNSEVEIKMRLENIGANKLEVAKIQAYQDGELVATKNWTGSLENGESEILTFEDVISYPGRNEIMVQIVELNNDSVGSFQSSTNFATFDMFNSNLDFDFFMQDKNICNNQSLVLGATTPGAQSDLNFIWRRKNGIIEDSLRTEISLTVSESDTYYLTVYDDDYACSISYEANIFFGDPEVESPLEISSVLTDLNCGSFSAILFAANQLPSSNMNWYLGDLKIGGGNIITVSIPGQYRFEVIYETEDCGSFSYFSPWATIKGIDSPPAFSLQQLGEIGCDNEKVALVSTTYFENEDRYDFQWHGAFGFVGGFSTELNPETHPSFFENGDHTTLLTNLLGIYSLTITDKLTSCKITSTIEVEAENDAPYLSIIFRLIPDFNNDMDYVLNAAVGAGTYEYKWTSQGGSILDGATTVSPTIRGYGDYSFKILDLELGCEFIQTYPLYPNNTVHFSSNCNLVDTNSDLLIRAYIKENSVFPLTIKWYDESGSLLSNQSEVLVDSPGSYMVEIKNGAYSEFKEFRVNENLFIRPKAIIGPVDSLICLGESIVLSAINSIIPENNTLTWRNSEALEISNSRIVQDAKAGAYDLEIANLDNGCTSMASVLVEEELIYVDAGDYKILGCPTTEVSLGGSEPEPGAEFTWRQKIDGDTVFVSNEATLITDQAGTYILEFVNEDGTCTATDEVVVYNEDEFIQIENISSDKCNNRFGLLSVNNLENYFDYDLIWTLPDGTESELPILRITEEGAYALRFFDDRNGCEQRDTFNFSSTTTRLSFAISQTEVGLSVEAEGGSPPFSFIWSTGADTKEVKDLQPGLYSVTVTDGLGCQVAEEIDFAVNPPDEFETIIISPNPSSGIINIMAPGVGMTDLDLVVYSISGQEIINRKYKAPHNEVLVELSAFPAGVYLFEIEIDDIKAYHRVLIIR